MFRKKYIPPTPEQIQETERLQQEAIRAEREKFEHQRLNPPPPRGTFTIHGIDTVHNVVNTHDVPDFGECFCWDGSWYPGAGTRVILVGYNHQNYQQIVAELTAHTGKTVHTTYTEPKNDEDYPEVKEAFVSESLVVAYVRGYRLDTYGVVEVNLIESQVYEKSDKGPHYCLGWNL